jgi:phage shock protein PspC (stress-responsive transcriptional regulator)
MKRVVTVNLNGVSFNFDEDAYDLLRSYMKRAEAQLASDPGRAEVLADLERSIAEKCEPLLHVQKNVVSYDEMRSVLAAIGVVNGTAEEGHAQSAGSFYERKSARVPLTQIREGAMISGVCNGLAVHFGFDVTLLRVIFVILAIVTSGAFVLAYAAMMFLIPYDTDVEKINDQSIPGFMFKLVTHTKRKLAGTS